MLKCLIQQTYFLPLAVTCVALVARLNFALKMDFLTTPKEIFNSIVEPIIYTELDFFSTISSATLNNKVISTGDTKTNSEKMILEEIDELFSRM